MTGTPLYTAISVHLGRPNTISSDLESLLYTLVDLVTEGRVPWRKQIFVKAVVTQKLEFLTDRALCERCLVGRSVNAELVRLVLDLRDLFVPSPPDSGLPDVDGGWYWPAVRPQAFLAVCKEALDRLGGPEQQQQEQSEEEAGTETAPTEGPLPSTSSSLPCSSYGKVGEAGFNWGETGEVGLVRATVRDNLYCLTTPTS